MLQAPGFECLLFDPFSLFQNGLAAPEVDVGGCDVVQALMVSLVVVVVYEGCDLSFKITGQEVIFQKNAVLQGLMPALDLALSLGMIGRASNMGHILGIEPIRELARDVAGPVVRQQSWSVANMGLAAARRGQRHFQGVGDVFGLHRRAELPGDHVSREVIQDRGQIVPAPTLTRQIIALQ